MNEGVIKEIKFEGKNTYIKVSLELKYEDKQNNKDIKIYNIFIYENKESKIKFPIMIDSDIFYKTDNRNIEFLFNKKCSFEIDEVKCDTIKSKNKITSISPCYPIDGDKIAINTITIKVDN